MSILERRRELVGALASPFWEFSEANVTLKPVKFREAGDRSVYPEALEDLVGMAERFVLHDWNFMTALGDHDEGRIAIVFSRKKSELTRKAPPFSEFVTDAIFKSEAGKPDNLKAGPFDTALMGTDFATASANAEFNKVYVGQRSGFFHKREDIQEKYQTGVAYIGIRLIDRETRIELLEDSLKKSKEGVFLLSGEQISQHRESIKTLKSGRSEYPSPLLTAFEN